MRRCFRDPTFSRFDTIPECDRHTHHTYTQTHRHTTTANTALSIASRGKKATKNAKIGVVWGVRGHPRSSETLPFDTAHMTSYSTLIETMRLSCTVFEF